MLTFPVSDLIANDRSGPDSERAHTQLRTKTRTGSRVRRMYDRAQTACQRVLASGVPDVASERRLNAFYRALDPVRLPRQLEALQEALWRHARSDLGRTRRSAARWPVLELSVCAGPVHQNDGPLRSARGLGPAADRKANASP